MLFTVKMAEKDNYIAALEKKLAELSGIEVDQIRKNQVWFTVAYFFLLNIDFWTKIILTFSNLKKIIIRNIAVCYYNKNNQGKHSLPNL